MTRHGIYQERFVVIELYPVSVGSICLRCLEIGRVHQFSGRHKLCSPARGVLRCLEVHVQVLNIADLAELRIFTRIVCAASTSPVAAHPRHGEPILRCELTRTGLLTCADGAKTLINADEENRRAGELPNFRNIGQNGCRALATS